MPAFERLAALEGIVGENLLLGKTAALHHDVGYIEQYAKNEPIGVRIATETLPNFGYSPNQIERIAQIIMSIQLQLVGDKFIQVPDYRDSLQLIMCDSDLDSLGRKDFFAVGENLLRELNENGTQIDLREWYNLQLDFQKNHSYFTDAAKILRNEQKSKNIC
ncbi:metal-dependent phosphohydrolase [Candidatus Pacearchaeota archaeon]|nr:metal-dependent phosphohydrolase [Candidatus Pacearchaeota archaeon]